MNVAVSFSINPHVAFDIPAARKDVSFGLKLCGLQRPERHLCTKLHKMEANLLLAKIFFLRHWYMAYNKKKR